MLFIFSFHSYMYYIVLQVRLYRDDNPDSPIHTASLGPVSFFYLPSLQMTNEVVQSGKMLLVHGFEEYLPVTLSSGIGSKLKRGGGVQNCLKSFNKLKKNYGDSYVKLCKKPQKYLLCTCFNFTLFMDLICRC